MQLRAVEEEFYVQLLGRPEILGPSSGVIFPTKGYQLFALLVRSPTVKYSRREIANFLWDGSDEAATLTNLRQLLLRIRKCFPVDAQPLSADNANVFLTCDASKIDVSNFSLKCGSEMLNELNGAMALFRGEFLEGIIDVTEPFQQWLHVQRAALRDNYFETSAKVLRELTRYGRADSGKIKDIEEKLLAIEPEREASFRTLIDVYGRIGEFSEAERLLVSMKKMLIVEHADHSHFGDAALARKVFANRAMVEENTLHIERKPRSLPRVAIILPFAAKADFEEIHIRGLIEDVASELSRFRSFIVLAPYSSLQVDHDYGTPIDNSVLRADYSVSGFIKKSLGNKTLSLRFLNVSTREILWAGEFRVDASELSESAWLLTKRICASIAEGLERDVIKENKGRSNASAFVHYLAGRESQLNCDLPKVRRARKAFTSAIELEPSFAEARARIAETLFVEWILRGGQDAALLASARSQADAALSYDPNVAVGHWISGAVALYQRDFDVVEDAFKDAEVLAPNCADLQLEYGDALCHLGEHDKGWRKFQTALDLNPLPPDRYWWFGAGIAFVRNDFETAVELCGKLKSEEVAVGLRAASFAMAGRIDEAREWGARVKEILPGMRATDFAKLAPDRFERDQLKYIEGLRLAGVE